jgi:hypothetical protein
MHTSPTKSPRERSRNRFKKIAKKGLRKSPKRTNGDNTSKPWGTTSNHLYITKWFIQGLACRLIIHPSHKISPWSSQASPIEILRKIGKPNELGFQQMAAILSTLGLYGGYQKSKYPYWIIRVHAPRGRIWKSLSSLHRTDAQRLQICLASTQALRSRRVSSALKSPDCVVAHRSDWCFSPVRLVPTGQTGQTHRSNRNGAAASHQEATIHRSSNHTWSSITSLVSALTTHTYSNPREKKKKRNGRKETSTSDRKPKKGKEHDHMKKTSLGSLRQGQRLDTSETNYAQAKSANHQTKAQNPQRAPPAHMQAPLNQCNSPWMNACKTPPETEQLQQLSSHRLDRSPSAVRPVDKIAQHLGTAPVRPVPLTGQADATWELLELKNSSKPLGNLLNACSKPFQAQTSPLVDNAWIKPKMPKIQPRASQIDKIQHRMLHMSKWAS